MIGLVRVRAQIKQGVETGKWFVDIPASLTSNGRRKRKLFDNQRKATEVARELRRRLDPVTGLLMAREKPSGITLVNAITGWEVDEQKRVDTLKKRSTTFENNKYQLRPVKTYFNDETLHSITEERLVEYQAHRLKLGRKPITINSEIATLSGVFKWAVKQGHIKTVPKPEQIPVRPVEAVIPTPKEVVRIIRALPERLQPIVRFLAETGCRVGEATNLTWDCVDEIGGYVEIMAREGWTPKTQQSERRIPINDGLLTMIRGLDKNSLYVFAGATPQEPIGSFKKAWATAVRNASLTRRGKQVHVPIKSLRKANATWQAERGVNESVLQGLLGHAKGSRVTKKYYVHATEEAKRAAVISLPLTVE